MINEKVKWKQIENVIKKNPKKKEKDERTEFQRDQIAQFIILFEYIN